MKCNLSQQGNSYQTVHLFRNQIVNGTYWELLTINAKVGCTKIEETGFSKEK